MKINSFFALLLVCLVLLKRFHQRAMIYFIILNTPKYELCIVILTSIFPPPFVLSSPSLSFSLLSLFPFAWTGRRGISKGCVIFCRQHKVNTAIKSIHKWTQFMSSFSSLIFTNSLSLSTTIEAHAKSKLWINEKQ